jgi:DMSO/TMAO reductase YedYZ molybdopterin-dependent catalytic subunit
MNTRDAAISLLLFSALSLAAATACAQERASTVSTQLSVSGEVQHTLKLSLEDVRAIGLRTQIVQSGGYSGVRLVDLLDQADIRRDAPRALRRTYVVALATDGYQAVFSWGELYNTIVGRDVLIAIERDGMPLRDGEGRFALISLSDEKFGARHVKWLHRIEVHRVPEPKD